MAWFTAHAIMYFKLKKGPQDRFTVWENIYLIDAADIDEAWEKATARARHEEGDDEDRRDDPHQPAEHVAGHGLVLGRQRVSQAPSTTTELPSQ